jgi:hypothetical protein
VKCLSVKQPYAYQIMTGEKPVEYRSWKVEYRGPLLITASASPSEPGLVDERGAPLPNGVMVCVVELFRITGTEGDYEWHLRSPRPVRPQRLSGRLGLFEVDDRLIECLPPGLPSSQATSGAHRTPARRGRGLKAR